MYYNPYCLVSGTSLQDFLFNHVHVLPLHLVRTKSSKNVTVGFAIVTIFVTFIDLNDVSLTIQLKTKHLIINKWMHKISQNES